MSSSVQNGIVDESWGVSLAASSGAAGQPEVEGAGVESGPRAVNGSSAGPPKYPLHRKDASQHAPAQQPTERQYSGAQQQQSSAGNLGQVHDSKRAHAQGRFNQQQRAASMAGRGSRPPDSRGRGRRHLDSRHASLGKGQAAGHSRAKANREVTPEGGNLAAGTQQDRSSSRAGDQQEQ